MSGKRQIHPDAEREIVRRYQSGERAGLLALEFGHNRKTITTIVARNGGEVLDQRKASGRPKSLRQAVVIRRGPPMGERHGNWKGGRLQNKDGYVLILLRPDDPLFCMAQSMGYALEHRVIMARKLGRPLLRSETVHHVNGDKGDNRPENLQLRHGWHGKGVVARCRCCGSDDVEMVEM